MARIRIIKKIILKYKNYKVVFIVSKLTFCDWKVAFKAKELHLLIDFSVPIRSFTE